MLIKQLVFRKQTSKPRTYDDMKSELVNDTFDFQLILVKIKHRNSSGRQQVSLSCTPVDLF